MPLQILSEPPPEPGDVAAALKQAIEGALPGAEVEVTSGGPGHFEISVVATAFEGQPRVRQQQQVYAAIAHLMQGQAPPVHAVDRMVTRAP
jgi:acid stress-induced BolA-like protein IbaG/YrbA